MAVQRHGGGRLRDGITSVSVGGFKSIATTQTIDIRPLTLLAGVNSSGKSSMLQPLLLLKQTLHSDYNPGALLLDGPTSGSPEPTRCCPASDGNAVRSPSD